MIPIYKDTYFTTTADTLVYSIVDSGTNETLFSGKAIKSPDSNSLSININRIVENYISIEFPIKEDEIEDEIINGNTVHYNAVKVVRVEDGSGIVLSSYTFYNDWSYGMVDNDWIKPQGQVWDNKIILSHPINNHYTDGQYSFITYIDDDSECSTDWMIDSGVGIEVCSEWAVYYLNRYGGWDQFVIEGKVVEKDEYDISKYRKDINNNQFLNGAEVRFANQVSSTYELNTHWLNDTEARRVAAFLIPSNQVFLHNVRTGRIVPVNITDTTADYKTFGNERKLISYKFNVKEANTTFIK